MQYSAAGLVAALSLATAFSPTLHASSITPGDLVIYRVGDGTAALGTTATPVFLDEYTTAGSLVQSIPLPTSGATALTAVGNATTEGIISRSQDGLSLVFGGYRKDAGGTNPSSDAPATTNRVIATVGLSGLLDTSVSLSDPTGTIRSATTINGGSYYLATSVAVRYVATPGPAATSTQIDARNSRQVQLTGNTLFASNGSTAITGKVQSYGTLPTGATAASPIVTLGTADAVNGFAFLDLSPAVPGDDTLYALSTVASTLLKYTFDGTSWSASGSLSASGFSNLTANGNGFLYLTSNTNLSMLQDTGGYGQPLAGSITSLATAGANTSFRGIGILAIPEPATALLLAGGWLLTLPRRRRASHPAE